MPVPPEIGASRSRVRLRWNYHSDSDFFIIYTAGQRFASLENQCPSVLPEQFDGETHILLGTVAFIVWWVICSEQMVLTKRFGC